MSFSIGSQIGSAIRSIGSVDSTPHPAPTVNPQSPPTPSNSLVSFVATYGLHPIAGGQAKAAAHDGGVTDALRQAQDGLSDTSQEISFEIQTTMQQSSEAASAKSNIQKKLEDAVGAINRNIRG